MKVNMHEMRKTSDHPCSLPGVLGLLTKGDANVVRTAVVVMVR
jgi:hypothetical protein